MSISKEGFNMRRDSIWITGGEGRIGSELVHLLKNRKEYKVIATDRDLDITDLEEVNRAADIYDPDIVINCASISDREYCEHHRLDAYKVNALGARNLAIASRRKNAMIIQLSTDEVFNGIHNRPKNEFDTPTPDSEYGKSKLAGEMFVREMNPKHLIIRSSWVYGTRKAKMTEYQDFYQKVLEYGKKGEKFECPIDMISSPTSTLEIARFLKSALDANEYGIFHVSCEGACTRREYARKILSLNGYDPDLCQAGFKKKDGAVTSTLLENLMIKITGIHEMADWLDALAEYVRREKGE